MTRKRFCKLLMGAGISRNEAELIALLLPPHHGYRELFLTPDVRLLWRWCRLALELKTNFRRSLQEVGKSMSYASDQVALLSKEAVGNA